MKILYINSVSGYGSTGGTISDLYDTLICEGYNCSIAYGQKSYNVDRDFKIGSKFENHMHNVLSRITGMQGYFSKNGTNNLVEFIKANKPDIIHLHNLHGNYLNLDILFQYLTNSAIPIVWTLHDCWAFTGKCSHYTEVQCMKWQTHCHHCPQIKKYPPSVFIDKSDVMFNDKIRWVQSLQNLTIVTVSKWLENQVRKSFLKDFPIITIYNWIDLSIFNPNYEKINKKYHFDEDKFIVLGMSAGWEEDNVKTKDFLKLASLLDDSMQLILIGGNKEIKNLPKNVIHIRYIHDKKALAAIFATAGVYVHLGLEDTFGKVIAESMACGTPVIAYNSTVYPEIVNEGCGFIVEPRNIEMIIRKVQKVKSLGKNFFSQKCIDYVRRNFGMEDKTQEHIKLYKNILNT